MKPKRQLTQYVISIISFSTLIIGFNWFINPFGLFSSPNIEGINSVKTAFASHVRMAKADAVRKYDAKGLILGSSKVEFGIDPEHPGWPERPVYNLGLSGGNIYEVLRYLKYAHKENNVKIAIVGLDFFMFNAYSDAASRGFNESYLDSSLKGRLKIILEALFTLDGLKQSINALKHQGTISYLRNGQHTWDYRSHILAYGHRAVFRKNEEEYMTLGYFPEGKLGFKFENESNSTLESFREIIQFCIQENIKLKFFISPSHARQWETIKFSGLWNSFEFWKRSLVNIIHTEKALTTELDNEIELWDFSGYSSYTTETVPSDQDTMYRMKFYWESTHFTKILGDHVLDRMFNINNSERENVEKFGVILTQVNIEAELKKIRLDQIYYEIKHPKDIEEIKSLAKRTSHHRPANDFSDYLAGGITDLSLTLKELSKIMSLSSTGELDDKFYANYGYTASEYRSIAQQVIDTYADWELIRREFAFTNMSLENIVDKHNFKSKGDLEDRFFNQYGYSIKTFFNSLLVSNEADRTELAKLLLGSSTLGLDRISRLLKFDNRLKFDIFFELGTGIVPAGYRKLHGKGCEPNSENCKVSMPPLGTLALTDVNKIFAKAKVTVRAQ
ncbi:MAG: hypothetical protein MJK11_16525 [Pseudomonadales bacterium]|uniref:hypothetical protein n=1 Tax=Moritella sp. TaxID=78556 RepID=UPI001D6A80E9|nr:hypothetical protein [Moritella sp.]MCJ8314561.1 hypothetical protein [Pseudomonadales bacterium]NQZ50759.1 hypothetical protein [Moritella sp.]